MTPSARPILHGTNGLVCYLFLCKIIVAGDSPDALFTATYKCVGSSAESFLCPPSPRLISRFFHPLNSGFRFRKSRFA